MSILYFSIGLLFVLSGLVVVHRYYLLRAEILPALEEARDRYFAICGELVSSDRVTPLIACLLEIPPIFMRSRWLGWRLERAQHRGSSNSSRTPQWIEQALLELDQLGEAEKNAFARAMSHAEFAIFANRPIEGTLHYHRFRTEKLRELSESCEFIREAAQVAPKDSEFHGLPCPA